MARQRFLVLSGWGSWTADDESSPLYSRADDFKTKSELLKAARAALDEAGATIVLDTEATDFDPPADAEDTMWWEVCFREKITLIVQDGIDKDSLIEKISEDQGGFGFKVCSCCDDPSYRYSQEPKGEIVGVGAVTAYPDGDGVGYHVFAGGAEMTFEDCLTSAQGDSKTMFWDDIKDRVDEAIFDSWWNSLSSNLPSSGKWADFLLTHKLMEPEIEVQVPVMW